jgi:hypothetical protein
MQLNRDELRFGRTFIPGLAVSYTGASNFNSAPTAPYTEAYSGEGRGGNGYNSGLSDDSQATTPRSDAASTMDYEPTLYNLATGSSTATLANSPTSGDDSEDTLTKSPASGDDSEGTVPNSDATLTDEVEEGATISNFVNKVRRDRATTAERETQRQNEAKEEMKRYNMSPPPEREPESPRDLGRKRKLSDDDDENHEMMDDKEEDEETKKLGNMQAKICRTGGRLREVEMQEEDEDAREQMRAREEA